MSRILVLQPLILSGRSVMQRFAPLLGLFFGWSVATTLGCSSNATDKGSVTKFRPVQRRAKQDTETKRAALEAVEKMRGFSMLRRAGPRSDGKPDIDSIRREEIMAQFRHAGKEAVPTITRVLKDSDVQMRRNATLVLIELAGGLTGKATVDTRMAMPSLINACKDPDDHVRAWAAHALAEIGPEAKHAVPILTKMLKDPEEGPRNTSAMALGRIGAASRTALPMLREALKDPKKNVRRFSQAAIGQIEQAVRKTGKTQSE